MIEFRDVTKNYGRINALSSVNLEMEGGKVTVIAGPNGSGKTTMIKSLLGLVKVTSGNIFVGGININDNIEYKRKIGYMPQIGRYPDNLKVSEVIDYIKYIRNGSADSHEKEIIELFDLDQHLNKYMRNLSGGTRQKVSAVLALMFKPEIYIFDEPTVGLDPISSIKFKERIIDEKKNGKTVLLISHIMSEIDELADKIVFMIDGKVLIDDELASLKKAAGETDIQKAIPQLVSDRKK